MESKSLIKRVFLTITAGLMLGILAAPIFLIGYDVIAYLTKKSEELPIPDEEKTIPFIIPKPKVVIIEKDTQPVPKSKKAQAKRRVIILHKRNTLVFRDVVTPKSVGKLINEAFTMSMKLKPSDHIYLVLNTPGGSISDGELLIDALRSLPQKVHTLSIFAASMGFFIVESLDDRLLVPSGELMAHRASISGFSGQLPGEAITRINYWLRRVTKLEQTVADRVNMSLEDFQELRHDEYWVHGTDAITDEMADEVVFARCGKSMMGTYKETRRLLFLEAEVTWSKCPMITYPLEVKMKGFKFKAEQEALHTLLYDKKEFLNKYIKTGLFHKYFK